MIVERFTVTQPMRTGDFYPIQEIMFLGVFATRAEAEVVAEMHPGSFIGYSWRDINPSSGRVLVASSGETILERATT